MTLVASAVAAPQKSTQSFSDEDLSFFAKEGRPILQNNCALCHDSGKHTSGFSVQSRESILASGNRGPAAARGLGFNAIEDKVHTHDIQATILHFLGLDHTQLTFKFQGRDFRLTDVRGDVIKKMLA